MMPAVVSTESAAQRNSARSMSHSTARPRIRALLAYCERSWASSCSMVTPTCEPPSPKTVPVFRALKCSPTSW